MGFIIDFYIIFGNNLLTQGPVQIVVFFAYFSVSQKRNIKRSRNRTKSTGEVIFGRKATGKTWSACQERNEGATRQGGAPTPLGRALHPRGPLVAPLTYFFRLYISIYPKTIGEHNRSGVPPPEASIATENQSRPVPAPCRRGNPSPVAIFIIPVLSMTRRE